MESTPVGLLVNPEDQIAFMRLMGLLPSGANVTARRLRPIM
jgi:hypothetical protein